jgi:magnesium-transporting ATPase (P-type)
MNVIVDGATLFLVTRHHLERFVHLTQYARAVIACRVTPGQKAEVRLWASIRVSHSRILDR